MDRDFASLVTTLRSGRYFSDRVLAAETLGRTRDPRAVEPLLAALRDEYATVRAASAAALAHLGDARAVPMLAESLARREDQDALTDMDARIEAAKAIAALGGGAAVAHLVSALEDPAPRVREAAGEALARLGWTPPSISDRVRYLLAINADVAGACQREPELRLALVSLLLTDPGASRGVAERAKLLGELKDPAALPYLVQQLQSYAHSGLTEVIRALAEIGDTGAILPLMRFLATRTLESDLRWSVSDALARFKARLPYPGCSALSRPLLDLLESAKSTAVICEIADWIIALGGTGAAVQALNPLVTALENAARSRSADSAQQLQYRVRTLLLADLVNVDDETLGHFAKLESFTEVIHCTPMYGSDEEPWSETRTCDMTALVALAMGEMERRRREPR